MRNAISFFLVFVSLTVAAQHPEDKRILEQLCSQDFAGRGYVNNGDSKSADFIASEFNRLGLKKFRRSYFQGFSFLVNTFPSDLTLSINGTELTPGRDYVVHPASPSGKYQRTTWLFSEAFSNANDILDSSPNLDPKKHVLVLDKVHFKTRNEQIILRTVVSKMAEIMPLIILNEGVPIWHVSQNQMTYPVFEMNEAAFVEGEVQMHVKAELIQHTARNVIARIPAKGKAKRRIVFTAHYDHLGCMGAKTFYAGANDNASGVTLLFSIARKLLKLQRNSTEYIFIAFAGEEVGLLGSKFFVENQIFDIKSIRFLLNLDIFGGAHHSITAVNGTVYHDEFECLKSVNEEMKITPEIKSRGESANSDHHWFHAAGVRCFFLYSGGLNPHYHVPWDDAKDVDLVLLDKTADLLVGFVGRL